MHGADGTGVLDVDPHLNFHEGENRGRRSNIARVTQMGEDVALAMRLGQGVAYDDMVVPLSQLKGGMTGVGGAADKTWTATPSMTAANNPEAYSIDVGDDVQNWRVQYGMMSRFKLAASLLDVTTLDATWFGQRAVKTAAAAPANNVARGSRATSGRSNSPRRSPGSPAPRCSRISSSAGSSRS
jgi:hypothetical protein